MATVTNMHGVWRGLGLVGCAVAAFSWAVPPAFAAPSELEKARRAYEQLDYDKVLPLVEQALAEGPTREEQIEAFLLMANVHIAYGRQAKAVGALEQLLARDPEYTLEAGVSPKLREALQEARARKKAAESVRADESVDETIVAAPTDDVSAGPDLETRAAPAVAAPLWTRWWVWTIAGAVVVLGVSTVAAWQLSSDDSPEADYGKYKF